MMYPVLNGMANWFDNAFDDFFDTRAMNRMNATAPAGHEKQEKVTEIISQKSPLSAEAAFL